MSLFRSPLGTGLVLSCVYVCPKFIPCILDLVPGHRVRYHILWINPAVRESQGRQRSPFKNIDLHESGLASSNFLYNRSEIEFAGLLSSGTTRVGLHGFDNYGYAEVLKALIQRFRLAEP